MIIYNNWSVVINNIIEEDITMFINNLYSAESDSWRLEDLIPLFLPSLLDPFLSILLSLASVCLKRPIANKSKTVK